METKYLNMIEKRVQRAVKDLAEKNLPRVMNTQVQGYNFMDNGEPGNVSILFIYDLPREKVLNKALKLDLSRGGNRYHIGDSANFDKFKRFVKTNYGWSQDKINSFKSALEILVFKNIHAAIREINSHTLRESFFNY